MEKIESGDFVKLKRGVDELNYGGYIVEQDKVYKVGYVLSSPHYERISLNIIPTIQYPTTITTTIPYFESELFIKYNLKKERKEKLERLFNL